MRTRALMCIGPWLGALACGGGQAPGVQRASSQVETVEASTSIDAGNPVATEVATVPDNERRILDYVPGRYSMLLNLSLTKLVTSEFFTTHESTLFGDLERQRQEVVSICHFDPVLDIQAATVGLDIAAGGNAPEAIFALTTSIGATQVEQCVVALGGTVAEGRYTLGGDSMAYYWPTEDILLLSTDRNAEELRTDLQASRAIDNGDLMQYLSRTDRHATLWGGGAISQTAAAALGGMAGTPTGFVLRGSMWAGVDLNLELSFKTGKDADGVMNLIKMALSASGQSPLAGDIVNAIDTELVGETIRVDAQFSPELSTRILEELK